MHKMRIISPRTTTRLKALMIVCNTAAKGNAKAKIRGQLSQFPVLVSFLTRTLCLSHLRVLCCAGSYQKHLCRGCSGRCPGKQSSCLWMWDPAWLSRAAAVATRSDLIKNSRPAHKAVVWSAPNCTRQAQQVELCYQTFSSFQAGKQLHFQPVSGITAKNSKEGMGTWGKKRG